MPRLALFAALLVVALLTGFAPHDAEASARSRPRTVRLESASDDLAAEGRMRFRTRRGETFVSATFTHLAPDTVHTLRWDALGRDGAQFTTDRQGRGRLRRMAVPAGAASGAPQVSITDEDGEPVLACDADSMPRMHDDATDRGTHHDADGSHEMSGMMGDHEGACPQECMDHCVNGGTCDEQCHEDHGCAAGAHCCCAMSAEGDQGSCDGMSGGSQGTGDAHRSGDGSSSGGAGTDHSGGMMGGGSGGMHSGGMGTR